LPWWQAVQLLLLVLLPQQFAAGELKATPLMT